MVRVRVRIRRPFLAFMRSNVVRSKVAHPCPVVTYIQKFGASRQVSGLFSENISIAGGLNAHGERVCRH